MMVMSAPKRKTAQFCKKWKVIKSLNIHHNMNATDFIAAGVFQESAGAVFSETSYAGINLHQYRAAGPMLKFLSVLENTIDNAGNLPDSEVFSRPESFGFGRDGLVRKAGRMALSMFSTSRPPDALEKAASGLLTHNGAKAMTNLVNTTTPKTGNPSPLTRQQAIENALSDALHLVRTSGTQHGIQTATGRAVRAAGMLKQACADFTTKGA